MVPGFFRKGCEVWLCVCVFFFTHKSVSPSLSLFLLSLFLDFSLFLFLQTRRGEVLGSERLTRVSQHRRTEEKSQVHTRTRALKLSYYSPTAGFALRCFERNPVSVCTSSPPPSLRGRTHNHVSSGFVSNAQRWWDCGCFFFVRWRFAGAQVGVCGCCVWPRARRFVRPFPRGRGHVAPTCAVVAS